jgi:hypothetical protein
MDNSVNQLAGVWAMGSHQLLRMRASTDMIAAMDNNELRGASNGSGRRSSMPPYVYLLHRYFATSVALCLL